MRHPSPSRQLHSGQRARPFSSGAIRPGPKPEGSGAGGIGRHYHHHRARLDSDPMSPPRKSLSNEELGDLSAITLGEYMTQYLKISPGPRGVGGEQGALGGGGGGSERDFGGACASPAASQAARTIGWGDDDESMGGVEGAAGSSDLIRSNGLDDTDCVPREDDEDDRNVRLGLPLDVHVCVCVCVFVCVAPLS